MVSVAICVLTVALCLSSGFHQGYIATVLNQPYIAVESFINTSWIERTGNPIEQNTLNVIWSALNVIFPASGILGQFLAAYLCRRFGRKNTAILSSFLYLPGIALSYASKQLHPAFELLFVGRFIWSLANGIHTVNATVWIVECAPTKHRGRMAALQEVFMATGSLLCQTVGVPFSTDELWPNVFVPPFIVSLIAMGVFCFTWESPQYIIDSEKNLPKARRALAFYHGKGANCETIDEELRVCEESLMKKSKSKSEEKVPKDKSKCDGFTIMFNPVRANDSRSKVIRAGAWIGVMVKVAYVFTGARCLRAYSTFVLYHMGQWNLSGALYGSFFIGLLRLPFTFVPVFLVERIGRRPLILGSMLLSLLSLFSLMMCIFFGAELRVGTFASLTALLLVNASGLGSISRFYSAELVPRSLLINSVSILTAIEAITKIAVEFAFYPLAYIIGGSSMLLFLVPTLLFTVLSWYMCPETSGKQVNEVLNSIAKTRNIKVTFQPGHNAVLA